MVSVKNKRNTVRCCNGMNMARTGNSPENGGFLFIIRQSLTCPECSTTIGELYNYRCFGSTSGFKNGINRVGANHVYSRNGKTIFFGDTKDLLNISSGNYTGFYNIKNFHDQGFNESAN